MVYFFDMLNIIYLYFFFLRTYIHICQVPDLNTPNEGGIAFAGYTRLFFCNQHKWASLIKKVMHSLRTQKRVLFSKCFFHIVFLESLKLKKE